VAVGLHDPTLTEYSKRTAQLAITGIGSANMSLNLYRRHGSYWVVDCEPYT